MAVISGNSEYVTFPNSGQTAINVVAPIEYKFKLVFAQPVFLKLATQETGSSGVDMTREIIQVWS